MIVVQKHGPYYFGSPHGLSPLEMKLLADCFNLPRQKPINLLEGRAGVQFLEIDQKGPVAVKTYFRGGLAGRINKKTYFSPRRCRGQSEFDMLRQVRSLDINAPEPVAFAFKGRIFKNTWLITRMIPHCMPLSRMYTKDPESAKKIMAKVIRQVKTLIENKILHVDLHPGNILVTEKADVYLIDFDKAVKKKLNKQLLQKRYMSRWQRAVEKYHLPLFADKDFCSGLLES